jgi:hypothetical protein
MQSSYSEVAFFPEGEHCIIANCCGGNNLHRVGTTKPKQKRRNAYVLVYRYSVVSKCHARNKTKSPPV